MDNIIPSNLTDYQSILINSFTAYLVTANSADATIRNYCSDISGFLKFLALSKQNSFRKFATPEDIVKSITKDDIAAFKADLANKKLSFATINRQTASIRSFMNFAIAKKWRSDNPADLITPSIDIQSVIDTKFDKFLIKENASYKTRINYRSDLKSFFGFLIPTLDESMMAALPVPESICKSISAQTLENYKIEESIRGTPVSTINRRLSALRLFLRFAVENRWLETNPAETIANVKDNRSGLDEQYLLNEYIQYLSSIGINELTRDETINDLKDFISWVEANPNQAN
jgi:site-specific recombinase XerD